MPNFCPICKASCDKQCALYYKKYQMCAFQALTWDIGVIANAVSELAEEKQEVKR